MADPVEQRIEDPPAWEKMTDMPVGEVLRRARMHYNLSLDDVAATLHIRAQQLGALEENRPEQLPGRVYAIGFVRAYSEYLGLDGDKMVHLFKVQSVGGRQRPELSLPAPASESKAPGIVILAAAVIMLAGVLMGLVVMGKSHKKGPPPIPPVSVAINGDVPALASSAPLAMAMQAAVQGKEKAPVIASKQPAPAPSRIGIRAADSVWLEIRDARNKPILSRILKAGDSYDVPDQPGLRLDTGDAGALEFVVDGQGVAPLGVKGDVLRNVTLTPAGLKNPPPPQPAAAPKTGRKRPSKKEKPEAAEYN
jgi:cytoskeleton protein RodZ